MVRLARALHGIAYAFASMLVFLAAVEAFQSIGAMFGDHQRADALGVLVSGLLAAAGGRVVRYVLANE